MKRVWDDYQSAYGAGILRHAMKRESLIHRLGPWKSADAVEWETLKWVDWFNKHRLPEPIGYITPTEAEAAFNTNMNALEKVA